MKRSRPLQDDIIPEASMKWPYMARMCHCARGAGVPVPGFCPSDMPILGHILEDFRSFMPTDIQAHMIFVGLRDAPWWRQDALLKYLRTCRGLYALYPLVLTLICNHINLLFEDVCVSVDRQFVDTQEMLRQLGPLPLRRNPLNRVAWHEAAPFLGQCVPFKRGYGRDDELSAHGLSRLTCNTAATIRAAGSDWNTLHHAFKFSPETSFGRVYGPRIWDYKKVIHDQSHGKLHRTLFMHWLRRMFGVPQPGTFESVQQLKTLQGWGSLGNCYDWWIQHYRPPPDPLPLGQELNAGLLAERTLQQSQRDEYLADVNNPCKGEEFIIGPFGELGHDNNLWTLMCRLAMVSFSSGTDSLAINLSKCLDGHDVFCVLTFFLNQCCLVNHQIDSTARFAYTEIMAQCMVCSCTAK